MLQSSGDTSCVSAATLDQGQVALEKIESKISLEQFRTGMKSATEWQQALQARLNEFTQTGPEQAENVFPPTPSRRRNRLASSIGNFPFV